MKPAKKPLLECFHCGYEWTPRVLNVKECPSCKNRHWARPRPLRQKAS